MDAIRLSVGLGLACLLTATPVVAQKATPKPPKPQISATTREKAAEEHANPDALVLADFQKRVDAYMAVHRDAKKGAPPQVLMNLPKLPPELEYRIINKNLIIRDVDANIIVDFVPNAIQ